MTEKCNADMLLEVARWRFERNGLAAQGASPNAIAEVDETRADVFVTYDGPLSALRECHLTVGHYDGVVATGSIRLRHLDDLRNLAGVTRISLAARVSLHIDRSIPEIKANLVRSNAPPYVAAGGGTAYTGKGVLVGIIDDGIYERHFSFTHPNPSPDLRLRKTRFIAIWNTRRAPDTTQDQVSPQPYNKGTLWTEEKINKVLGTKGGYGAIGVTSLQEHGSHVTGIAVGNGSYKDGQFAPYTFVGVAPEADIVFCNPVSAEATGASIAEAMNFIFGLATERGQACVINMSFGTHEGARDGSSDLEQAIDRALLDANGEPLPGRAVVVAAGNDSDMRRHSRKLISPGGKLAFRLDVGEVIFATGNKLVPRDPTDKLLGFDKLYIWHAGGASIQIRVTPPGGPPDPPAFVKPGEVKVSASVGVSVSDATDPANGKKLIVITLFAPTRFGRWTLELQETAGVGSPVDIWVDRNGDAQIYPRFIDGDDVPANTVTSPATAKHAIAVGAYISEPSLSNNEHYGEINLGSSQGLDSTFGASDEEVRPHITAPGRRIVSANNSSYGDKESIVEAIKHRFDEWTLTSHTMMTGTSQAAPHVTGTVALMFERNPNLTAVEVRSILEATATHNQIPVIGFPNRVWGYGKLDANAAVAAVPLP